MATSLYFLGEFLRWGEDVLLFSEGDLLVGRGLLSLRSEHRICDRSGERISSKPLISKKSKALKHYIFEEWNRKR